MKVKVLGPLVLTNESDPVDVGGPRQQRLLAALALNANHVVSSDALVEIVFGDTPPAGARSTLRSYVARLRSSLKNTDCPDAIITEPSGYRLDLDQNQCDAEEFAAAVDTARSLYGEGGAIDAAAKLKSALAMWRGAAYWEFSHEDWVRGEATRLEELRIDAEELLIEAQMACGATRDVIPDLTKLVESHPFREVLRGQLMLAMHRSGRQADALRSYERHRSDLVEIGLEPGPDLVLIEQQIARNDPALDLKVPAGTALRGYRLGDALGEDRLGTTYRAIQPGTGRPVVVRAIRGSVVDSSFFIQNFDRLAGVLARLEHPHIVPLHDFWREPSVAYIVMRLLPTTLGESIVAGPASIRHAQTIVEQAGRALTAAHRVGLVHAGLGPANVHLDEDGDVFLADLGLRELIDDRLLPADSSTEYVAPELVSGSPPTPASDQFSLASVLVHVLTGKPPFAGRGFGSPDLPLPSLHSARASVPLALDPVLAKAMAWNPQDRYPALMEFVSEAIGALGGEVTTIRTGADVVNPFRGLEPFLEADASWFFGRETVVDDLVGRLGDAGPSARFVTLVGASGSGKSSTVLAGLVPQLRHGAIVGSAEWLIATMVPGAEPFAELAAALSSISSGQSTAPASMNAIDQLFNSTIQRGQTALLVIDQLEELFTLTPPAERDAFITGLTEVLAAGRHDLRVVVTLRADFYDRPLQYGEFGRLVAGNTVTLLGMTAGQLGRAVREPALSSGVEMDPVVAARIVAKAVDDPAALPLLQFTLTELFDRRRGAVIDIESYDELGGIETVVASRADGLVESLPIGDQDLVRRLFLLLVTVDLAGAVTRNRMSRSELASLGSESGALESILDTFGSARLLSFDRDPTTREPTVEVAHEALTTHWPRLGRWMQEQGDGIRIHSELRAAAAIWKAQSRDESCLYRGGRLKAAEEWATANVDSLAQTEQAFLDASIQHQRDEESAARAQQEKERRSGRKLRWLMIGIGVVVAVALGAGLVASNQRGRAADETRRAAALGLVAASGEQVAVDPELGLLLAIEAVRLDPAQPAEGALEALHTALLDNRLVGVIRVERAEPGIHVTLSPDGSALVTVGSDPRVMQIWSTSPLEPLVDLVGHGDQVNQAVYSEDGLLIATTSLDGSVRVWDSDTGEERTVLRTSSTTPTFVPRFSPDGTLVAASSPGGQVFIWDVESAAIKHVLPGLDGDAPWTFGLAFSPSGSELAVATNVDNESGVVAMWDWAEEDLVRTLDAHDAAISDVEYSPDGLLLYTSSWDGRISEWDAESGELSRAFTAQPAGVNSVHVSGDGHRIAAAGIDGVSVWDVASLDLELQLLGHAGGVQAVNLSPEGTFAVTSSLADGTVRVWNTRDRVASEVPTWTGNSPTETAAAPPLGGAAFAPGGDAIATAIGDRIVVSSISGSGVEWEQPLSGEGITSIAFGDDGMMVAAASNAGVFIVDPLSGSVQVVFAESEGSVAVAVDRSGGHVAWAGRGAVVASLASGQLQRLVDPSFVTADIAFSPGERPIVALVRGSASVSRGEEDLSSSIVELFDAETFELTGAIRMAGNSRHTLAVTALAFDSDGGRLVTASEDATAVVWDSSNLEPIVRLIGHTGAVNDVAFDPTRNQVATGSSDGTLRIWDADSGAVLITLQTTGLVADIAYSPDGSYMIATDSAGSTTLFIIDTDLLLEEAIRRTSRTLTPAECETFLPTLPCPSE